MRLKRLLLILPLMLVFAAAACDNDSSSNAAAPPPEGADACPCFSAEDIKDDARGKSFFGCVADPKGLGISLDLSEGDTEFVISTDCPGAFFGNCQCADGVREITSNSVTREQYFDCVDLIVDAIRNEFDESMCLLSD